ncbi:MAG: UDP-galactopyranose mutase [Bacillales bacterium]|jgi:UDP-galactopyranose mutase|nr:UDP-galactopyranose mutase [Bacillales bacterium]
MKYDYLIVGSGLFGAVMAHELTKINKKVLVIDKREHLGGNIYTYNKEGIIVHKYGAHIFHTSNKKVWDYVNGFVNFNNFINCPLANYKGTLYNLPFNMYTFYQLFKTKTPQEAREKLEKEKVKYTTINNLEEQALSLVGKEIYEKLIKDYTTKQWGTAPINLPSFIIKRLPIRFVYDNNYFNDIYQGIATNGYTELIEKLLEGIDTKLNYDFFTNKNNIEYDKIIFTGQIDEYYDYKFGPLSYRSLRFEDEYLDVADFQGNAVINYASNQEPFTRIIEHQHFNFRRGPKTLITKEYSESWTLGKEAYYPINDEKNNNIYQKYLSLAQKDNKVIFGGRLGSFAYLDMDKTIEKALELFERIKDE